MKKANYIKQHFLTSPAALRLYPGIFLVVFYSFQVLSTSAELLFIQMVGDVLLLMLPVYLNLLMWFPYLLRQKRYMLFATVNLLTIVLAGYIPELFYTIFINKQPLVINLSNAVVLVLLSTGYQYAIDYFREQHKQRQLERKQLETELQLLRMQLNPHFLFNTLNNLYGLAIAKSDRLPELMLKLSELLRYLHDEASKEAVFLEKELGFLENYIELQRMRLSNRVRVEFQKNGDPGDLLVAPALMINFVENGFKHLNTENSDAFIKVETNIQDNVLDFRVVNSKRQEEEKDREGSGLRNIQKRLEMLYPDRYHLTIQPEYETYFIQLKLELPWLTNASS